MFAIKLPKMKISIKPIKNWLKKMTEKKSSEELRKIEKMVTKFMLIILFGIMILPLIFWSGHMRWLGVLFDLGILYALYKSCFRDIAPVHIGLVVSPFWGRLKEYKQEGKCVTLPWDKIEEDELKVKVHPVKEDRGYFTAGGAPVNLTVDIFYRIDRDNIYLYKEVEGLEGDAIDGKVKEFLYTMIGTLDTDEVVARQGEIAKGVLEEIRLHPISSKEKQIHFLEKKKKEFEGELELTKEKRSRYTVDIEKGDKAKIQDLLHKIDELKLRINKIEISIAAFQEELDSLYEKELRKYKTELELELQKIEKSIQQTKNEQKKKKAEEILTKIKDETVDIEIKKNLLKARIEEIEEKALSELEEQFAIRIIGSRTYGFDIADDDAKKGRSKRTTVKFERDAILTEWGTTDMIMTMLKDKYPSLTDHELLEAVLVNRGRIEKGKKVIEIEGLTEIVPQITKIFFDAFIGKNKKKEVVKND